MAAQVEAVAVAALRRGSATAQVEAAAVQALRRGSAVAQVEQVAVAVMIRRYTPQGRGWGVTLN